MGYLPFQSKKSSESAPYNFHSMLRYILLINWNLTDTFFLMGGLLCSYVLLTKLDKTRGAFDYIKYAFYRGRYITITNCFAIVPNFVAIFDVSAKPNRLSAMDGIRAILCFWMILQHEYDMGYLPFQSKKASESAPYNFHSMLRYILLINWNLTDTFFLMGVMLGSFISIAPKLLVGIPHFFEAYKSLSFDTITSSISHHLWGFESHVQLYVLGILVGFLIKRHPNVYLGGIIGEIGTTRERIFYSNYYVWTVVLFDYITTFILSIIVNVLVTKPFANLLNMIYKREN
ncbi:unnamed protein product [Oppiella nova]|uniref:Acyltransferase 3 domain-containing protein n=1 Tax=Oppiella nova TaxID=334625 RepID=A0A7R9LX21_9ACAR|nr:unnamed protein product [Oppiella nova]CAG2167838.1 unnamed protein product [Oppiella nova]